MNADVRHMMWVGEYILKVTNKLYSTGKPPFTTTYRLPSRFNVAGSDSERERERERGTRGHQGTQTKENLLERTTVSLEYK